MDVVRFGVERVQRIRRPRGALARRIHAYVKLAKPAVACHVRAYLTSGSTGGRRGRIPSPFSRRSRLPVFENRLVQMPN